MTPIEMRRTQISITLETILIFGVGFVVELKVKVVCLIVESKLIDFVL